MNRNCLPFIVRQTPNQRTKSKPSLDQKIIKIQYLKLIIIDNKESRIMNQ